MWQGLLRSNARPGGSLWLLPGGPCRTASMRGKAEEMAVLAEGIVCTLLSLPQASDLIGAYSPISRFDSADTMLWAIVTAACLYLLASYFRRRLNPRQ